MANALSGIERSLFLTLAFAVFAAVAAGLAARAVDRVAGFYEQQRQDYAIVRVLAPEGPAGLAAAESALTSSRYVTRAAPMSAARAAALLGQWGGREVRPEDLPPLRLIEIELAPAPADIDVSAELVAALAQGGVTAEIVGAPGGASVARRVTQAATWGAAAFAAVMALIVALSARSLAARRREMVTVMADLGATRGQAAGRIGDEAALIGLYAGMVGALLATLTAAGLLFFLIPGLGFDMIQDLIRPIDIAPLIAAPVAAALAAGTGARTAAGLFYAQAARIA